MNNHPDLFSSIDMPSGNSSLHEKNVPKENLTKTSIENKDTSIQLKPNEIIKEQINLSSYLSPYANTSHLPTPEEATKNLVTHPQIKIVPLGTGSGKSYSSVSNYIQLQSMKTDLSGTGQNIRHLHRNKGEDNFTNGIFITPIKNQIDIDSKLVGQMWEEGITPVSIFSLGDITDSTRSLWCSDTGITIKQRLSDYKFVLGKLEKLAKKQRQGLPTWIHSHIYILKSCVIKVIECLKAIEKLKTEYQKNELSAEIFKAEMMIKQRLHGTAVMVLTKALLDNEYGYYDGLQSDIEEQENIDSLYTVNDNSIKTNGNKKNDSEKDEYLSEDDVDAVINQANESNISNKSEPYHENKVYSEIFENALPKKHFDELVSDTVGDNDNIKSILATLKKDILRVYAPMNFASYLPCFICMTTAKARTKFYLFRKSHSNSKSAGKWVLRDVYSDLAELVGNKVAYRKAISSLPPNISDAKKAEMLRNTLLLQREDLSQEGKYDERTVFKKRDIDFYIIIDECNEFFINEMMGNEVSKGVVEYLLPERFSITDVMSCVERKFREFVSCGKDIADMHCYKATALFFGYMHGYLRDYCDIDVEKVLNRKADKSNGKQCIDSVFLSKFVSISNVLYINNSEADALINIAENAFTVGAKNFIDKDKLQSIYFKVKGHHGYLSLKADDAEVTLYDMYQVLVAVIYACIKLAETSKLTASEKQSFLLDLAYLEAKSSNVRQNSPLQMILRFANNNHREYIHWLETKVHANNDEVLDDWYAYIQTKLVFSLMLNKAFDASADEGHKTKTFIDVGLYLVTHHPELNLLRMVDGTSNHVAIMSATSGREVAYSCQYNISFLQKWGGLLGVKVSLPEYDNFFKKDYRDIYRSLRQKQSNNRTIEIHHFDDLNEILRVLDDKDSKANTKKTSGRLSALINAQANTYSTINKMKNHLVDVSKKRGRDITLKMWRGSYNDKAFERGLAFLLLAFRKHETSLHTSLKANLTSGFQDSILNELQTKRNKDLLNNALKYKEHPIFVHGLFGDFQLPLLNKYIDENNSINSTIVKNQIEKTLHYMIDFLDMKSEFRIPEDVVVRLALYDKEIDKLYPDYRTNFEVSNLMYKGIEKTIYTHVLSYNKIVSVGLNNTINNVVLGVKEDINNLFLSSLSYYSLINEKDNELKSDTVNGLNKIENALFYMRYLSDDKNQYKRTTIKSFDTNLSSDDAREFLLREHNYHINNDTKQTLGRTERVGGRENFISNIYLPKDDLMRQAKIEYDSAKLNKEGKSELNKIDYEFMSMNNMAFYEAGVEVLEQNALDSDNRKRLEDDTKSAYKDIDKLTSRIIPKNLILARAGNKSEEAQRIAQLAIRFDKAYRETTILSNPVEWKSKLKCILEESPELVEKLGYPIAVLNKCIDSAYVDVSKYSRTSFDLYEHKDEKGSFTDFFGKKQDRVEPYNPYAFVVKDMTNTLRESKVNMGEKRGFQTALGYRLERLLEFNNSLVDEKSNFYANNENKDLILHFAMLHMALGNMGEAVFDKFLELFEGNYKRLDSDETIGKFGYRSYELFDFWLQRKDGSNVCVDVKNMSHRANREKTERHFNQQESKVDKISNSLYNYNGLEKLESLGESVFKNSNKVYLFYINIRENIDANNKKRIKKRVINGKEYEYHIYNVCLFQTFRRFDFNSNYKTRKWMGFLSIDLLELLDIDSKPDEILVSSVTQVTEDVESDSYEYLEFISKNITYDYDDSEQSEYGYNNNLNANH